MREILEKLLEKDFKVTFSEEAGVPVLCIHKGEESGLHLQARHRPFQRRH